MEGERTREFDLWVTTRAYREREKGRPPKLSRTRSMVIAVLLLISISEAQAQIAPSELGQNAALQYWPAFNFLPRDEADLKILENWKQAPLDEKNWKLVEGHRYLHAGAQMKQCDWSLDLNQGPYLLLPFLNKSRPLTYAACLRVRFDISQKKWATAVEDGSDAMAAARHVAVPPIMISLLVSYANERDAIDAMASGLNSFDPESLSQFLKRLDSLPPAQTQADSLNVESHLTIDWAIQKVKTAGPKPDWNEVFGFLMIDESGKPAAKSVADLISAAGGTPEGVVHQLENLLVYYQEAAKLTTAPLNQSEFNRQALALASKFDANPFAKPILPNLPAAHDGVVASQTRLALFKTAIAVVQHGSDAAKGVVDPVNHEAVTYEKLGTGFKLSSKVMVRGQPVTLTVGAKQ